MTIFEVPTEEDWPEQVTVNTFDVSPTWMPPLQDFNVGTTLYKWFRVVYDGARDVQVEPCGDDGEDALEWTQEEDLADIVCECRVGTMAQAIWAIENELSPGQPFLVCFDKPTYHYSSYDGETDVEHSCGIVRKLPVKPESACKAWERVLLRVKLFEEKLLRRRQHVDRIAMSMKPHWRITVEVFGEDRAMLELSLKYEAKGFHKLLAQGRSGDSYWRGLRNVAGTYTEAFWQLVEDFRKRYPAEDVSHVLALAKEEVEITRWDRLRLA